MMEFGALHCTPKNPDCLFCPLQAHCLAFDHHTVAERPVKLQKAKVRTRYLNYLVIRDKHQSIYLRRREGNDIWRNLYDFPCIESDRAISTEELLVEKTLLEFVPKTFQLVRVSPVFTHKLTHQTLIATFFEINISDFLPSSQKNNILLVPETEIDNYPIPKLIEKYLLWQA